MNWLTYTSTTSNGNTLYFILFFGLIFEQKWHFRLRDNGGWVNVIALDIGYRLYREYREYRK